MSYEAVPAEVGKLIVCGGARDTVQESCGGKGGAWFCVTCDKHFENNFAKDSHLYEKPKTGDVHVMAWHCQCGQVEAP